MATIKRTNDNNFPFAICDGWGGEVACDLDDLSKLRAEIDRLLAAEMLKEASEHPDVWSKHLYG